MQGWRCPDVYDGHSLVTDEDSSMMSHASALGDRYLFSGQSFYSYINDAHVTASPLHSRIVLTRKRQLRNGGDSMEGDSYWELSLLGQWLPGMAEGW